MQIFLITKMTSSFFITDFYHMSQHLKVKFPDYHQINKKPQKLNNEQKKKNQTDEIVQKLVEFGDPNLTERSQKGWVTPVGKPGTGKHLFRESPVVTG